MAREAGARGIADNDAVDEALCFGWIDSLMKPVDGERRAQRFTPRRPSAPVSPLNLARIRRLMQEGRMTKAGLDAIGGAPAPPPLPPGRDGRGPLAPDPDPPP